jgi:hypothetical protein
MLSNSPYRRSSVTDDEPQVPAPWTEAYEPVHFSSDSESESESESDSEFQTENSKSMVTSDIGQLSEFNTWLIIFSISIGISAILVFFVGYDTSYKVIHKGNVTCPTTQNQSNNLKCFFKPDSIRYSHVLLLGEGVGTEQKVVQGTSGIVLEHNKDATLTWYKPASKREMIKKHVKNVANTVAETGSKVFETGRELLSTTRAHNQKLLLEELKKSKALKRQEEQTANESESQQPDELPNGVKIPKQLEDLKDGDTVEFTKVKKADIMRTVPQFLGYSLFLILMSVGALLIYQHWSGVNSGLHGLSTSLGLNFGWFITILAFALVVCFVCLREILKWDWTLLRVGNKY